MRHRSSVLVACMAGLVAGLVAAACDQGYQRGNCDPGYLDVNGTCTLAVGQDCDGDGDCISRICLVPPGNQGFCTVGCNIHDDCPVGFFCTMAGDHLCHPGQRPPPCTESTECQACETCAAGFCSADPTCVRCAADEECAACERCDAGECVMVAGCSRCDAGQICLPCNDCNTKGECQRRFGCTLCASPDDCPGCMNCSAGACAPIPGCGTDPCLNDGDCPDRTRCLPDSTTGNKTCLPVGLAFGADCGRGKDPTCAEGVCVEQPDLTFACSRPCESAADCPTTTSCLPDQACVFACRIPVTPAPGGECQSDLQCRSDDRVCGLVVASSGDSFRSRCLVPLVCARLPGEACDRSQGDRCTTGVCTLDGFCTAVCASDFDCPVGFLCGMLGLPLPAGGMATFLGCAPMDLPRAEVGEACPGGDGDCRSGLCLAEDAGGAHPYCSMACTEGAADCPDRFTCRRSPLDESVWRCQPSLVSGACGRDSDCLPDEVCTLALTATACAKPVSGGATGEPCASDAPCQNGLCLPTGRCGALCLTATDCPAGTNCDFLEVFSASGERAYARSCMPPAGGLLPCRRDTDCQATEVCSPVFNPYGTGFDGQCATEGTGGGPGASCRGPFDCRPGFCPADGICRTICAADSDCPADTNCFLADLAAWDGASFPIPVCIPRPLAGLGEPCPNGDTDCQSGLCHQPAAGDPYCSVNCSSIEDCAGVASMVCSDLCIFPP